MPLTQSPTLVFKPLYELIDEPLVNGIWSSSFQVIGGLRILAIYLHQHNDEVADKDLNLRLIIDGVVHNSGAPITFTDGGNRYLLFTEFSDNIDTSTTAVLPYVDDEGHQVPLECSKIQVLVGLDSAAGTNQRYHLRIRWFGT